MHHHQTQSAASNVDLITETLARHPSPAAATADLWGIVTHPGSRYYATDREQPSPATLLAHARRMERYPDPLWNLAIDEMEARLRVVIYQSAQLAVELRGTHREAAMVADMPTSEEMLLDLSPPVKPEGLDVLLRLEACALWGGWRPWSPTLKPLIAHWYKYGPYDVERNDSQHPLLPGSVFLEADEQLHLASMVQDLAQAEHLPSPHLPGLAPQGGALPQQWYDLGTSVRGAGRGAPIPLRLIVTCLTSFSQTHWHRYGRIVMTYRELLRHLWPERDLEGRKRQLPSKPQRGRLWKAFDTLHSMSARVAEGNKLIQVFTVGDIPRPGDMDEMDTPIEITVRLPDGSTTGPRVPRVLLENLGVENAAAYRLLPNLANYWWQPGRTRVPVGNGRMKQSRDPDRYPHLTDDDLAVMAHPTSSNKARRFLRFEARKAVELLSVQGAVVVAQDSNGRWKYLPPEETDQ